MMEFKNDDGGRVAAGFEGKTGDCVTRAIAIATGRDYREVYDALFEGQRKFGEGRSRAAKVARKNPSPRTGVFRKVYQKYLEDIGWEWVPTMKVGEGCTTHLRADELPSGRIIARVSKHLCAVIDGVIHDTHDPSRNGSRCVYGYFIKKGEQPDTPLQEDSETVDEEGFHVVPEEDAELVASNMARMNIALHRLGFVSVTIDN